MNRTRRVAYEQAERGRCVILQKGKVIEEGISSIRGPIRIRATPFTVNNKVE